MHVQHYIYTGICMYYTYTEYAVWSGMLSSKVVKWVSCLCRGEIQGQRLRFVTDFDGL